MIDNYRKKKLDEYTRENIVDTVGRTADTENALCELGEIQSETDTRIEEIWDALVELAEGGNDNG